MNQRQTENELRRRLRPITCSGGLIRWREDQPFEYGARGAMWCGSPGGNAQELAIFTFPDPADLAAYWPIRIGAASGPIPETDDACGGGTRGTRAWANGLIACFVDSGEAKIRWTDDRTNLYGVLDATDRDLASLYRWWRGNARTLGHDSPEAQETTTPDETS